MKYINFYKAPFSLLEIINSDSTLLEINFVKEEKAREETPVKNDLSKEILKQLDEYFKRKRKVFALPLAIQGSKFEEKIYEQLCNIEFGDLRSYKDIAKLILNPRACRAVGNANAKNKIPIIVPCHRVIASDRKIAGYSGGINKKEWLLEFEGHNLIRKGNANIFLN